MAPWGRQGVFYIVKVLFSRCVAVTVAGAWVRIVGVARAVAGSAS